MNYINNKQLSEITTAIDELQQLNEGVLRLCLEFVVDYDDKEEGEYFIYDDCCEWLIVSNKAKVRLTEFAIIDKKTGRMHLLIPLINFNDNVENLIKMLRIAVFRCSILQSKTNLNNEGECDED